MIQADVAVGKALGPLYMLRGASYRRERHAGVHTLVQLYSYINLLLWLRFAGPMPGTCDEGFRATPPQHPVVSCCSPFRMPKVFSADSSLLTTDGLICAAAGFRPGGDDDGLCGALHRTAQYRGLPSAARAGWYVACPAATGATTINHLTFVVQPCPCMIDYISSVSISPERRTE